MSGPWRPQSTSANASSHPRGVDDGDALAVAAERITGPQPDDHVTGWWPRIRALSQAWEVSAAGTAICLMGDRPGAKAAIGPAEGPENERFFWN